MVNVNALLRLHRAGKGLMVKESLHIPSAAPPKGAGSLVQSMNCMVQTQEALRQPASQSPTTATKTEIGLLAEKAGLEQDPNNSA
jgi:hypothetical protein